MGEAGSGKDTMADYLVAQHDFTKMSLADEMKRIVKKVYDFTDEQLWGPSQFRNAPDQRYQRDDQIVTFSHPEPYLTPRMALQTLGTEWGRTMYLDTWVDLTLRNAQKLLEGGHYYNQKTGLLSFRKDSTIADKLKVPRGVVIADCRFLNEIRAIRKAGGKVVRLYRAGRPKLTGGVEGHASEMEQRSIPDSEVDALVSVEEGIQNFYKQIKILAKELKLDETLHATR